MFRSVPGGLALQVENVIRQHQEKPIYPKLAKKVLLEGDVVVRYTIDEKGVPIGVQIISGHELFREETLRAAKLWLFEPVKYEGKPVQATFELVFRYMINRV